LWRYLNKSNTHKNWEDSYRNKNEQIFQNFVKQMNFQNRTQICDASLTLLSTLSHVKIKSRLR